MNYPEWKQGSNYNTGDIVVHKGKHYRTKKPLYDICGKPSDCQPNNTSWEEVMIYPPDLQAVELLTKVCEFVWDVKEEIHGDPQGRPLRFLNQIDELPEWWDTHKPKTEREQKLDKVANTINEWRIDGNEDDTDTDNKRLAEQILTLLGL